MNYTLSDWKLHKPLIGILLAAALLSGCKTTYDMKVDAVTNPQATTGESYVILPMDPNTDTSQEQYQDAIKWIKTALSGKGMYEALTPEEADMIIELDFGIEPPRREFEEVQEPVYTMVKEPDRTRVVTRIDPATGKPRQFVIVIPGQSRQEIVGFETNLIPVLVNEKYLEIIAKENVLAEENGDKPSEELWSVVVRNTDENNDLEEYLPILASAAADYMGEDTGEEKRIRIKEDDEVVTFIKGGTIKREENDSAQL